MKHGRRPAGSVKPSAEITTSAQAKALDVAHENRPLKPERYPSSLNRYPWNRPHRNKQLDARQKNLKERPCRVHTKVIKTCKNCRGDEYLASKRRDKDEDITPRQLQQREYFRQWKERSDKKETLYVRLRPEDKTQILFACELAGLSITDFVVNSALEASKYLLNLRNKR
jgi:hypothetical protein